MNAACYTSLKIIKANRNLFYCICRPTYTYYIIQEYLWKCYFTRKIHNLIIMRTVISNYICAMHPREDSTITHTYSLTLVVPCGWHVEGLCNIPGKDWDSFFFFVILMANLCYIQTSCVSLIRHCFHVNQLKSLFLYWFEITTVINANKTFSLFSNPKYILKANSLPLDV